MTKHQLLRKQIARIGSVVAAAFLVLASLGAEFEVWKKITIGAGRGTDAPKMKSLFEFHKAAWAALTNRFSDAAAVNLPPSATISTVEGQLRIDLLYTTGAVHRVFDSVWSVSLDESGKILSVKHVQPTCDYNTGATNKP